MSILNYLKERWIPLGFLFLAFIFSFLVYRLDGSFNIRESNARYITMGWGFLFAAFVLVDAYTLNSRSRKFRAYCQNNASSEPEDEFAYPTDRENAEALRRMITEYEKYKMEMETRSVEELEFITKWLHDVKVPIAAARLILESKENQLPADFYRNIYSEIFSIEESILQVFYELKSNRFFDDYKVVRTNTKNLIAQALKGYSNFFSYKKLKISVKGEELEVLTDEKWSSYILSQIISNAVKYTQNGGNIEIMTENEAGMITISIKNTGAGIAEQDLQRIFQKGFTSSTDRDGAKATGYGLFLSKKLSDLLGHSLTAESKPNEYAVFRLSFITRETLLDLNE